MNKKIILLLLALLIGIANGVVFVAFEWLVNHGTDFIWNEWLRTDEFRWRVVPLAIVASLIFTLVVKLFHQKRVQPVQTDPLAHGVPKKATLGDLSAVFVVGLASLLAGASLGPEASLTGLSTGLGVWLAGKAFAGKHVELLALASIGALLVVFFGSMIPALIPILLIYKQQKHLRLMPVLTALLAAAGSYLTLIGLEGKAEGFGTIPVSIDLSFKQYLIAFLLGAVCLLATRLLTRFIKRFSKLVIHIHSNQHWVASGLIFGLVLGLLYLAGGQTIQFSGNVGTGLLIDKAPEYSALALAGIVLAKLLVTAWSLCVGYRGGLVFPSVFVGVALSLLAGSISSDLGGPGATLGAIGGIFSALTSPALAIIMLTAMMPIKLIGIAATGVLGATATAKLFKPETES